MPRLLLVFCRLAALSLLCALAMLLGAASTASALELVQTETRVWNFELPKQRSKGLSRSATPRTHPETRNLSTELASGALLAADAARAGTAQAVNVGPKIAKQMGPRGWSKEGVDAAIRDPARTVITKDVRHLPGGQRLNDSATAFYGREGGYVVRNNRTGDIVQVSERLDPKWRAPWD